MRFSRPNSAGARSAIRSRHGLFRGAVAATILMLSSSSAWATDHGFVVSSDDLYRIDFESSQLQLLGPVDVPSVFAMTKAGPDTLYAYSVPGAQLWTIDVRAVAAASVGPITGTLPFTDASLTFDSGGTLLLAAAAELYSVDLETAQATLIGPMGVDLLAIAARGETLFGVDSENNLVRVDRQTAAIDVIAPLDGLVDFYNISVPLELAFDTAGTGWLLAKSTVVIAPPEGVHQIYRLTDLDTATLELVSHDLAFGVSVGIQTFALGSQDTVVAVPTLSEIGLWILGLFLIVMAFRLIRNRSESWGDARLTGGNPAATGAAR